MYAEPYDPKRPVVCFDETSTQLLAETRAPMPPRPGRPQQKGHIRVARFASSRRSGMGWPTWSWGDFTAGYNRRANLVAWMSTFIGSESMRRRGRLHCQPAWCITTASLKGSTLLLQVKADPVARSDPNHYIPLVAKHPKETCKKIKPFLRWAGGKQWISYQLAELIPGNIGTYYEPFLGGGALFFATRPERAVLSDVNPRLPEAYRALRDELQETIAVLKGWANEKETYYKVRAMAYETTAYRAAQFIYLNRTCWNGLYRVNRQGRFNVPFGNHRRAVFGADHLLEISEALQNASVLCCDFEAVVEGGRQGDFFYFDPPYTSLHAQNGFRQYNEKLFGWQDQVRLGRIATILAERGCRVVVSNASHESILGLYPGFSHKLVTRHSILAANPRYRKLTTEFLLGSEASLIQTAGK